MCFICSVFTEEKYEVFMLGQVSLLEGVAIQTAVLVNHLNRVS